MPHSRMPPTPPLRPSHPWPGVARGLGPRVRGRVLPDSPRSAPLTGGRFRRPAKTHEGTPSGAHFSRRCRVWRPAGGVEGVPGRRLRVREPPCVTGCGRAGPIRVRRRRRVTGPRRRRCAGGRAGRRRANRRLSNTARAARPMTGHRAEPVADVPPGVGLVWEDTRRPSTMKHIGEHNQCFLSVGRTSAQNSYRSPLQRGSRHRTVAAACRLGPVENKRLTHLQPIRQQV